MISFLIVFIFWIGFFGLVSLIKNIRRDKKISNGKWEKCARQLAEALQKNHNHNSELNIVYFQQDGKPIDIAIDLGEAYSESEMCEQSEKALSTIPKFQKRKQYGS